MLHTRSASPSRRPIFEAARTGDDPSAWRAAIGCWVSTLRSKWLDRPGMDCRSAALVLQSLDLRLDGGDVLGRVEHFQGDLDDVMAAGRQGQDPVPGPLEGQRVGIIR